MADVFAITGDKPGQINNADSDTALFLTLFSGEVMAQYRGRQVTGGRVLSKVVPPGFDNVQFRLLGSGTVRRHTHGKNVLTDDSLGGAGVKFLQQLPHGEVKVYLDRPNTHTTFSDRWENERNSYDVRGPIAREMAKDLAERVDLERFLLMIRAASNSLSATWKGKLATGFAESGNVQTDANFATDGAALLSGLQTVALNFDNADVPDEDRFVALKPTQYQLLVNNKDLLNRDFNTSNGVFSEGEVYKAWGMTLLKTTLIPTTDYSSNAEMSTGVYGETYAVNASNTVAICWQMDGMGSAEADAIMVDTEPIKAMKGTAIYGDVTVGHEILRADSFEQLKTA